MRHRLLTRLAARTPGDKFASAATPMSMPITLTRRGVGIKGMTLFTSEGRIYFDGRDLSEFQYGSFEREGDGYFSRSLPTF